MPGSRGGGVLALGEAVDPVVEEQDRHVHVAAQGVDQVVAADGERVAVTGDDPHREVGPRGGQPGRDRGRATVDRVHPVGVEVVREPRRAADAGDERDVLAAQPEVGQERLHGLEHGVVAAARAPAHLLVGGELLAGLRPVRGGHERGAQRGQVDGGHRVSPRSERWSRNWSCELLGAERHAAHGREPLHVDQVAVAQQRGELAEVHLRADDAVVAAQHLLEVRRHRVEVAQVHLGDRVAAPPHPSYAGADRAVRRAPADDQQPGLARRVVDLDVGHLHRVDLGLAGAHHQVVVVGVVGDLAGQVLLLDAADPVLEPGHAGRRPRAGQRLRVAGVGQEGLALHDATRTPARSAGSTTRRAAATARSRWPGSRRTAGSPGCGG